MNTERTAFDTANANNNNFDAIESTAPAPSSLSFIDPIADDSYNMFYVAFQFHCELGDPYDTKMYYEYCRSDDVPNHVRYDMMRLFDADLFASEHLPSDELLDDHIRFIVLADVVTGSTNVQLWLNSDLPDHTDTEIMFASDDSRIAHDLQQFHSFRYYMNYLHS